MIRIRMVTVKALHLFRNYTRQEDNKKETLVIYFFSFRLISVVNHPLPFNHGQTHSAWDRKRAGNRSFKKKREMKKPCATGTHKKKRVAANRGKTKSKSVYCVAHELLASPICVRSPIQLNVINRVRIENSMKMGSLGIKRKRKKKKLFEWIHYYFEPPSFTKIKLGRNANVSWEFFFVLSQ